MAKPILLFGRDGQLGLDLASELASVAPVVALGRADVDLTNAADVRRAFEVHAPAVVINAAAYTAVDAAESNADTAFAVNDRAVETLARESAAHEALLVHFSTDYVFDGESCRPYREEDATSPLGVYGASKLAGERALLASDARALIFRISWLYARHGRNFLRTMSRLFGEGKEVRVVDDQHGSPTWTGAVATAVHEVLEQARSSSHPGRFDAANDRLGLYHLTSGEDATWFAFASAIKDSMESSGTADLVPIPTTAYPTPVRRPRSSVLNSDKAHAAFGVRLPPWREQLAEAMAIPATR